MLKIKLFIIRTVAPLLIMYALMHQNGKLLAWVIVELPKILAANTKGENDG